MSALAQATRPRIWHQPPDGAVLRTDVDVAELPALLAAEAGTLWVDLDSSLPEQVRLLHDVFGFHPLSIEDTASANGRIKVEEFPGYLFVVVRAVRFVHQTEDPYDVETFNLCCFLGRNFLVTVHGAHAPGVEALAERCVRAPDRLARGPARLLHEVLDATVDAYFPLVDQLDEFVDSLEERVFVQFDQEAMRDIFGFKRLVLHLRRHLAPQREVFASLANRPNPLLPPEEQLYFRDVYDHVIRLNESLDTFRDLLTSTMDSYLTQVSNRLGMVTKGLTVVATVSVPFVVVSGMWGMNFVHIPLAEAVGGFWWMLSIQCGLGAALLWYLRRSGYL